MLTYTVLTIAPGNHDRCIFKLWINDLLSRTLFLPYKSLTLKTDVPINIINPRFLELFSYNAYAKWLVPKLFSFSCLKIKLILLPFHFHNRILLSTTIESIKNCKMEMYLSPILNQGFCSCWATLQEKNSIYTQDNILLKHIILTDSHKYLLLSTCQTLCYTVCHDIVPMLDVPGHPFQ